MHEPKVERATAGRVFDRVLVGVDASPASRAAAVQAARLVAPGGTLELAAAIYLVDANLQGWPEERVAATLEREARPWLDRAAAALGPYRAATRLLNGPPKQALLDEARRYDATLVAVGTHEHSRLSELVVGGVGGPVLREAQCSVLVARPASADAPFPAGVVVGVDGSDASLAALAVGEEVADRFGVSLRAVVAEHGDVDIGRAEMHAPRLEIDPRSAVEALVDAGAAGGLVVVGSRRLRGLAAVGSTSERVAHAARSSVLVVRTAPASPPAGRCR